MKDAKNKRTASALSELESRLDFLEKENTALKSRLAVSEVDSLASLTKDMLLMMDRDGKIIYLNQAAHSRLGDLTGLSMEQVFQKNKLKALDGGWLRYDNFVLVRALQGEIIENEEISFINEQDLLQNFEVNARPVLNEQKQITGAIGVFHEVTKIKQIEIALQQSEERFRAVLENSLDAAYRRNLQTDCYDYMSPTFECITGWSVEEMATFDIETVLSLIHPDDLNYVSQEIERTMTECRRTGRSTGILEYRFKGKNGLYRWLGDTIVVLPDKKGEPLYRVGNARDITQQKMTQQALQESEARYRTLVEIAPEGIAVHSEGKWVFANAACLKILDVPSLSEFIGKPVIDFVHPDDREAVERRIKMAYETQGTTVQSEVRLLRGDGRVVDVEISRASILFEGKAALQIIIKDISERKQAENALRSSEEKFRNLFEKMAQGVVYQNADGEIVLANLAAQRILGLSFDQMCGRTSMDPDWRAVREDGSNYPGEFHPAMEALQTCKPVLGRIMGVYHPLHQAYRWININAIPEFRPGEERPCQVFVTLEDITEQKAAREALQASEERYHSLFNSMTEGFSLNEIVYNEQGVPVDSRFLDVNLAFEILTGLKREDVIGKLNSEILPDDDPYWFNVFCEVALTGRPVSFENFSRPLNRYYEVNAFSPKLGQFAVLFMDITEHEMIKQELQKAHNSLEFKVKERTAELAITNRQLQAEIEERKKVEESLKRANTYTRSLIEASLDPLVTITQQGVIGDVNAATELATGYQRGELIGTDFARYFTDPEKAQIGIDLVFERGAVFDYELEIRHKDDQVIPVLYNASVYYDEAGQIIGAFAAARNISQRKKVEEQVRLLATALEAAANGIFITDHHGNILWCNPSFMRMSGYSMAEMVGQNPRLLNSGYQSEMFYQQFWQSILSGKPWQGEIIDRRKDGTLYIVEQTITPTVNERGEIINFIAIQQEISERKKAEQQLREQEKLLNSVLELLPVGVGVTDMYGAIIHENPARKEIWEAVKYIKKHPRYNTPAGINSNLMDEKDWKAECLKNKQDILLNSEFEVEYQDGGRKHILYSQIPLRDEANQVKEIIMVTQDITQLKQIEQSLEADRQRLIEITHAEREQRKFAESLAEATLVLNSSLNLDDVFNDILEQILRFINLRAVNICLVEDEKVRFVHYHGFEDTPEVVSTFAKEYTFSAFPLLQKAYNSRLPQYITDVRNEPTWVFLPGLKWVVTIVVLPLFSEDRVIGFLNIMGDQVTTFSPETIKRLNVFANQSTMAIQNARLYENLAKSLESEKVMRKKLIQEEKFYALGRMLASVSHEINSPLQTIKNCLFLFKKSCAADDPIHEFLNMAVSETARIDNLVAQLRELYRPSVEGKKVFYPLSRLLGEVSQLIAPHLANHNVNWEQDPVRVDVQAYCVPEQVKQVIINLSMNAVDAMQPEGGILKTGITVSEDGLQAGVVIQDNGPGIPEEIMASIFEPFFTTKTKGLGLGLSICYDLIQRQNGHISVESQANKGSTFTIWLPMVKSELTIL
jgi:PAS domain S-box-containing protein